MSLLQLDQVSFTNIELVSLFTYLGQWQRQVDSKTGIFTSGDILDEALEYFKANVLFRTFEVKGAGKISLSSFLKNNILADILLIYSTLYISQCLGKIKGKNKADATKQLFSLGIII